MIPTLRGPSKRGLPASAVLYAEARDDASLLAVVEDAVRDSTPPLWLARCVPLQWSRRAGYSPFPVKPACRCCYCGAGARRTWIRCRHRPPQRRAGRSAARRRRSCLWPRRPFALADRSRPPARRRTSFLDPEGRRCAWASLDLTLIEHGALHGRVMTLDFAGAVVRLILDQGFGAWSTPSYAKFGSGDSADRQAAELAKLSAVVSSRNTTYVVVTR